MIRYLYNKQFNPPAPFVHVCLRSPTTGAEITGVPALVDTAADRTTIPLLIATNLQLSKVSQASVSAYGGATSVVPIFPVQISIRDLEPLDLSVFGNAEESYVVLGRDVLNRYRVVLDGPQLAFEIS